MFMSVTRLAILGIPGRRSRTNTTSSVVSVDVRSIRRVALAVKLIGLGVHGQRVGVVDRLDGVAALKEGAEAARFFAVAAGVAVGGRRAEALLLFAVAAETEFGEGGDDEEDAVAKEEEVSFVFSGFRVMTS